MADFVEHIRPALRITGPPPPPPQGCHWDLIVLFKDGSRCVVAGAQPEELVPDEIIDALDDSAPFWPGQAVGIRASSQIC